MKSGIYKIENKNGGIYVGQTVDIDKRWYQHKNNLRKNKHGNIKLQRAWNKYGEDYFTFSVLEYVSPEQLTQAEQKWLDIINATVAPKLIYNIAPVANSQLGIKRSNEFKEKIIAARTGSKHNDSTKSKMSEAKIGKKHSEEHIAKRVAAHIGMKHSDDTRIKMSKAHTGKKQSEEQIAKRIALTTGKKRTEETKRKIAAAQEKDYCLISPDNIKYEFRNLKEFCLKHGLSASNMSNFMHGRRKSNRAGWKICDG